MTYRKTISLRKIMRILDIFHNISYLINSSLVEVNQAIFCLVVQENSKIFKIVCDVNGNKNLCLMFTQMWNQRSAAAVWCEESRSRRPQMLTWKVGHNLIWSDWKAFASLWIKLFFWVHEYLAFFRQTDLPLLLNLKSWEGALSTWLPACYDEVFICLNV